MMEKYGTCPICNGKMVVVTKNDNEKTAGYDEKDIFACPHCSSGADNEKIAEAISEEGVGDG